MGDGWKVVVTDYIEEDLDWEAEQLSALGLAFEAHQLKQAPAESLLNALHGARVAIVNMASIDEEVLRGLRDCRLIIRHGAGYDNVDIDVANERGIDVARIPDYCVQEVAEQAFMLVMACRRALPAQLASMAASIGREAWDFDAVPPVHSLQDKTLAVVGCGRIGSAVLRMAAGFGMRRIMVDPMGVESSPDGLDIPRVSLAEALVEADVVSIHTPLDPSTKGLFGEAELKLMRPTAVLVNTARGGVVDLDALDAALAAGEIAGAGIDVYEQEPPGLSLRILKNPRAICTPHLAWLSEEAKFRIRRLIVEEIRRHLAGEPPRFPVTA